MKKCKFNIGDRVDINVRRIIHDDAGFPFMNERMIDTVFGPNRFHGWTVIYRDFDKSLSQWIVWIESVQGQVKRVKEIYLSDRPENFARTQMTIQAGNTAREILGMRKEAPPQGGISEEGA